MVSNKELKRRKHLNRQKQDGTGSSNISTFIGVIYWMPGCTIITFFFTLPRVRYTTLYVLVIKVYLHMQPDSEEAQDDRHTASHLIKRRKQLHSAGLSTSQNRYAISDNKTKSSWVHMIGKQNVSLSQPGYLIGWALQGCMWIKLLPVHERGIFLGWRHTLPLSSTRKDEN